MDNCEKVIVAFVAFVVFFIALTIYDSQVERTLICDGKVVVSGKKIRTEDGTLKINGVPYKQQEGALCSIHDSDEV